MDFRSFSIISCLGIVLLLKITSCAVVPFSPNGEHFSPDEPKHRVPRAFNFKMSLPRREEPKNEQQDELQNQRQTILYVPVPVPVNNQQQQHHPMPMLPLSNQPAPARRGLFDDENDFPSDPRPNPWNYRRQPTFLSKNNKPTSNSDQNPELSFSFGEDPGILAGLSNFMATIMHGISKVAESTPKETVKQKPSFWDV